MGRDMVGLVAFDLILGIVFRGVMHMPLVVEVAGVDGYDRPRYPAGFGIPAHVIADLESFGHLPLLRIERDGTLGRQQPESETLLKIELDGLIGMAEITDRNILADIERKIAAAGRDEARQTG